MARASVSSLAVIVAALAAVGAAAAAKGPYLKANAQLLVLARPYPGAGLLRVESDPYRAPDSDYGPVIGYTTVAYYVLPRPVANQSVASFYARELRGWHERITTVPCQVVAPPPGAPVNPSPGPCPAVTSVSFTKGNALIQVQGLDSGAHYGVAIDSDYGENAH